MMAEQLNDTLILLLEDYVLKSVRIINFFDTMETGPGSETLSTLS